MKARIKFVKYGSMRFVGHLDIMRYFQKAFRRAEIDMLYSHGFSPHQLISFAAPLGVGLTSEGEYLDIEVGECLSSQDMIDKINSTMVEGIEIVSFGALSDESKNAMSIVAAADYLVSIKNGYHVCDNFQAKFQEFYQRKEINILKKTKKSEKEVNIKPLIYAVSSEKEEFNARIGGDYAITSDYVDANSFEESEYVYMQIATGSVNNLKPDLIMEAFCQYIEVPYNNLAYQVHRMNIYANTGDDDNKILVALEDFATNISCSISKEKETKTEQPVIIK